MPIRSIAKTDAVVWAAIVADVQLVVGPPGGCGYDDGW